MGKVQPFFLKSPIKWSVRTNILLKYLNFLSISITHKLYLPQYILSSVNLPKYLSRHQMLNLWKVLMMQISHSLLIGIWCCHPNHLTQYPMK